MLKVLVLNNSKEADAITQEYMQKYSLEEAPNRYDGGFINFIMNHQQELAMPAKPLFQEMIKAEEALNPFGENHRKAIFALRDAACKLHPKGYSMDIMKAFSVEWDKERWEDYSRRIRALRMIPMEQRKTLRPLFDEIVKTYVEKMDKQKSYDSAKAAFKKYCDEYSVRENEKKLYCRYAYSCYQYDEMQQAPIFTRLPVSIFEEDCYYEHVKFIHRNSVHPF